MYAVLAGLICTTNK